MDLLVRIPECQPERRADLQRVVADPDISGVDLEVRSALAGTLTDTLEADGYVLAPRRTSATCRLG